MTEEDRLSPVVLDSRADFLSSDLWESFDTVVAAGRVRGLFWRDLRQFRELFLFLCWRDILVRYKQTAIGVAWSLLRPFLTMVVFTVVFGKLAKMPAGGAPYPILVFAALLPWQLFASSLAESSGSLIANANLLTKVYFPRLIIPASAVLVSLVDFMIGFAILVALMGWYRYTPGWQIVTVPFFLLLALAASLGAGLLLAALTVTYRDFRYVVPFLVQVGLYISPVGFSSAVIPGPWRLLYSLNPMVGVIDGFRWAILGSGFPIFLPGFAVSCLVTGALLATGLWYFRATERSFADVI